MSADLVLSIDLGSSWCKAAYVDRQGQIVAEGRARTREISERSDTSLEQFWQALITAVRLTNASLPSERFPDAIGLSCRGLFGICLDQDGRGFIPSYDILSTKSSSDVTTAYKSDAWGNDDPYAFGYTVRVAGLLAGLRRTSPREWRRIHRVGSLHDYLVYRLSGAWVTDPATGPNMLQWPAGLMGISGLPLDAFPVIQHPWQVAGGLSPRVATALGLPENTPVVVGLHDGAAANIGTGAVNPGDACLTLGTNFALRVVTGERPKTDCFGYVVAPDRWAWVNSVSKAATRLDVVADTLLDDSSLGEKHRLLGAFAADVPPTGLAPLPLLDNVESLSVAVSDAVRQGYTPGEIYRSTLQATASGVNALVGSARKDGAFASRYIATGGGVHNRELVRTLAETLGAPIQVGHAEAGILGAGMVAAIGAGWFPTLAAAWDAMGSPPLSVSPDHQVTVVNS